MALVSSDLLRSTLEFAYPIVTLIHGDVKAGSMYCEVGGFFTAYFFELSDWMIFIIAIHTAVYVFNPKLTQASDEGGLWRWRYWVFGLWLTFPALLAGLAFIHTPAYIPLVTWCYLPVKPLVWRYTLAWGPRYFIFFTISVLYVALYVHVRRTYRNIDRNQNGNSDGSELDSQSSMHIPNPVEEPTLSFPPPTFASRKRPSIPSPLVEVPEEPEREPSPSSSTETGAQTLDSYTLNNQSPADNQLSASETQLIPPTISPIEQRNLSNATTLAHPSPPTSRRGSVMPTNSTPNMSIARRRAQVERQMRTLFIFPIVYFIMWIPPFINHIYQVVTYDDTAKTLPSAAFPIAVLATIFLPAQGFVNVCVYAARERPWRQRRRRSSARNSSFLVMGEKDGTPVPQQSPEALQAQVDAVKNRLAQMANPAQAAFARREVERAERELARAQYGERLARRRSEWWEVEHGVDDDA
jgi:G protein-coupled receptor GPR1